MHCSSWNPSFDRGTRRSSRRFTGGRAKRRGRRTLIACSIAVFGALLPLGGSVAPLDAQTTTTRWRVDPQTSLAWWQIDPHYNHLWATTCPADPSWQPGEGRDPGHQVNYLLRPETRDAGISDPRVPLYPRAAARPLCGEVVEGEIRADTTLWRDVAGSIAVRADALVTGFGLRDGYARRAVLETQLFPEIRFTIDSLTSVQPGDTLRATAVGVLELHGVATEIRAPVRAWREGDGLRVLASFQVDPQDLIDVYQMSRWALGMGVVMGRWKTVHAGIDVVLRPPAPVQH